MGIAPSTLPADFFRSRDAGPPSTLPADFFKTKPNVPPATLPKDFFVQPPTPTEPLLPTDIFAENLTAVREEKRREQIHTGPPRIAGPEDFPASPTTIGGLAGKPLFPIGQAVRELRERAPAEEILGPEYKVARSVLGMLSSTGQVGADTIEGLSTPANLALIGSIIAAPAIGIPKLAVQLGGGVFSAAMAKNAGQRLSKAYDLYLKGDIVKAGEEVAGAGVDVIFAALTGRPLAKTALRAPVGEPRGGVMPELEVPAARAGGVVLPPPETFRPTAPVGERPVTPIPARPEPLPVKPQGREAVVAPQEPATPANVPITPRAETAPGISEESFMETDPVSLEAKIKELYKAEDNLAREAVSKYFPDRLSEYDKKMSRAAKDRVLEELPVEADSPADLMIFGRRRVGILSAESADFELNVYNRLMPEENTKHSFANRISQGVFFEHPERSVGARRALKDLYPEYLKRGGSPKDLIESMVGLAKRHGLEENDAVFLVNNFIKEAKAQVAGVEDILAKPKLLAAPEIVPRGTLEAPARPAIPAPEGTVGTETTLRTVAGEQPTRYRVVEADSLEPSHNPMTFAKNPNYPEGVQPRQYKTNKSAQMDVINISRKPDFSQVVNTDPTAIGGPPQVTPSGIVIGGNTRAMALQRIYRSSQGKDYKAFVEGSAEQFGIDPAAVRAMKRPVLVRELPDAPTELAAMARLAQDLNQPFTKPLAEVEAAVSAGQRLTPGSVNAIVGELTKGGEAGTLRDAMASNPTLFRDVLLRDGVFAERDLPQYFTSEGAVNTVGKDFIENALLGKIVSDADVLQGLPKSISNKLERAIPSLIELGSRADAWNILPEVIEAAQMAARAQAKGWSVEKFIRQGDIFERPNERVQAIAELFTKTPTKVADSFKRFTNEARAAEGSQLFEGTFDPVEAFGRIIRGERIGDTNTVFTRKTMEESQRRLDKSLGGQTLRAGIDPILLPDLIKVGGFWIEAGLREFPAWSAKMLETSGEKVRPHLRRIYAEANHSYLRLNQPSVILPKIADAILKDFSSIVETGAISKELKPAVRVEARRISEELGQPDVRISIGSFDRLRSGVVKLGEKAAELEKAALERGESGKHIDALFVLKQEGEKWAQAYAEARRVWGKLGQEQQKFVDLPPEIKLQLEKLLPPESFTEFLRKVKNFPKPGVSDMLYEFWINSLLSGPLTHIVNTTSNTLVRLSTTPEKAIAGGIDFLVAKLEGRPQEVKIGEAAADIYGSYAGLREGLRNGLQAFRTEEPVMGISRLEAGRPKSIPGAVGQIIRIPGRALMAADEIFKSLNFSAAKHSSAYRQAAQEGFTGQARAKRISEILESPPPTLDEAAGADMLYRVFQQPYGPWGAQLSRLRATVPGLRYIVPFLRTPANITKFGLERTPFNFLRIAAKSIKGEKGFRGPQLSEELAKPVLGTLIGMGIMQLASEGYITGNGPKNQAERRVLYEAGWQPYSLKIGQRYYSFSRLEPVGSLFGMSADLYEGWGTVSSEDKSEAIDRIIRAISFNFTSKTYLTGLTNAINAISDPERYGEDWVTRFVGTVVPTGIAQIARATDPYFRRPETLAETLKSRVPGLSKEVPARLGVFGEPSKRGGTTIERSLSPFYVSEISKDPVAQELVRLKMSVGEPPREITVNRQTIELTAEEYGDMSQEAGRIAHRRLTNKLSFPNYRNKTDEEKKEEIKKVFREARTIARERMKHRPEIRKRAVPTLQ